MADIADSEGNKLKVKDIVWCKFLQLRKFKGKVTYISSNTNLIGVRPIEKVDLLSDKEGRIYFYNTELTKCKLEELL